MKVTYGAMPLSVMKMPSDTKLMVKYFGLDGWQWWLYPHQVDWGNCYEFCRFNWWNLLYAK